MPEARKSVGEADPLAAVRGLLTRWGQWVRTGRPGPASYHCLLGHLRGGGLPSPPIADEVAEAVDQAIGELKRRLPAPGRAIEHYYTLPGISYERLGRVLGISRRNARIQARDLVLVGEHWLDARLAEHLSH